jgi:hypothetical protein
VDVGVSNATAIAGVDTRVFHAVLADTSSVRVLATPSPAPRPARIAINVGVPAAALWRDVALRPSFSDMFDGVAVDYTYLLRASAEALAADAAWLGQQVGRIQRSGSVCLFVSICHSISLTASLLPALCLDVSLPGSRA